MYKFKTELIQAEDIGPYLSFDFIIQELLFELSESVIATVIIQV